MGDAIITRRGGGSGYVTINFDLPASPLTPLLALGITTPLSTYDKKVATTVGNYALFGGKYHYNSSVVDAYNTNLTRTTPTELSQARSNLAATTVGNYALFGGGYSYPSDYYTTVDAYDQNLQKPTPQPTGLSQARSGLAATTVGNYALFGGGNSYGSTVDAYDQNLQKPTPQPTGLSVARGNLAATTVGNYALFGGGNSSYATVDAYDQNLQKPTSQPTGLSQARSDLAATTVGNYALFGGGTYNSYSYFSIVDAYNTSLTRTTPTALSKARGKLAATTLGNYALFGGGDYYNESSRTYPEVATVDVYDQNLAKMPTYELSDAREGLAATTLGNYALFGGGDTSNVVDVFFIPIGPNSVQLFPGTKYSFNGSEELVSDTWQTISISGPLVGYIKVKKTTIN